MSLVTHDKITFLYHYYNGNLMYQRTFLKVNNSLDDIANKVLKAEKLDNSS